MDSLAKKVYQSNKTVLTIKDLALIWQIDDMEKLHTKAAYYVKRGILVRLSRGIFAKDLNYDPKELAGSIYFPSYISFETALREAGIIFQHNEAIFVAASWSFSKIINKRTITFRKLKDAVLFNPAGIKNENNYSIASPERAFLDMIYLFPNYYFDNPEPIDWNKCDEIIKIYNNKEMVKRLNKYKKNYA